jgi:hypothetical protein
MPSPFGMKAKTWPARQRFASRTALGIDIRNFAESVAASRRVMRFLDQSDERKKLRFSPDAAVEKWPLAGQSRHVKALPLANVASAIGMLVSDGYQCSTLRQGSGSCQMV